MAVTGSDIVSFCNSICVMLRDPISTTETSFPREASRVHLICSGKKVKHRGEKKRIAKQKRMKCQI